MDEFALSEAQLAGPEWKVAFRRARKQPVAQPNEGIAEVVEQELLTTAMAPERVDSTPKGMPVTSPMNGIYYASPSPSAPPFVHEGEAVVAGQVVGLIEAMKVFNEIVAPVSGTVEKVLGENGQLVQPGDALLYIV